MESLLRDLGQRVRRSRADRSLTRRQLSDASGLSVRFLSQLESGQGNISVLKLARVAEALGTTADRLLQPPRRVVALLGLRGAGKSSVGPLLARRLDVDFVELDRRIEANAGMSLAEIFSLSGEESYRRFERESLQELLADPKLRQRGVVVETGGGIVSDSRSIDLLADTLTVWLRARPEEHLERVLEQGDRRPVAGRDDALDDLRRLLAEREPRYARADVVIDTSGRSILEVVEAVAAQV